MNIIGSIQTQQKLELKRPKSVLNYKTKRNTKQTPWNMIKHDQTDKIRDYVWFAVFVLFVWFESLRPSQQSFSYVGTGLPGLIQNYARINVSCSMTRRSDAGEARNRGPLVSCSQCLNTKCGQSKRFGTGPGRRPDWAGYGSRLFGQTHSCHPLQLLWLSSKTFSKHRLDGNTVIV